MADKWIKSCLLFCLGLYQGFLSTFFHTLASVGSLSIPPEGMGCRHLPTCSTYAKNAITRFGAKKGAALAIKRLLGCHPFSKKPTFDPIPERE